MVSQIIQSLTHCGIDTFDCVQLPPYAVVVDNADICDWADDSVDGKSLVRLCVPRRTLT